MLWHDVLFGLGAVFAWQNLLMMAVGLTAGIVLGAIPGLTATMGVAVLLPLTFGMTPATGMLFLLGIYAGGIYGGSITAILIRTPGTPAAAATVLDGYPMTRQGRAADALLAAIYASVVGGLISGVILLFFAPAVARFALRFGPPEYFALAVFGLSIISTVVSKNIIKGLIAAALGMLISSIGLDPIEAMPRFTFGVDWLTAGVSLIPALIGLFAVAEILRRGQEQETKADIDKVPKGTFGWRETRKHMKTIVRGGLIGSFIGAVPGTGPAISAFLSYNEAKRTSKHPERYGKGEVDGVAASESANNGVTGATLIPLLTLGIPGDTVTAVLLGALMIHGLTPGPQLFQNHGDYVYTVLIGFIIVNILMFFIAKAAIPMYTRIVNVSQKYLMPIIFIFCVAGSYAVNNEVFDIWMMLIFGLIGYFLPMFGFSVTPVLLAIILGPMAETALRQTMITSAGDWSIFLHRPIALFFLAIAVLMVGYSFVRPMLDRRRSSSVGA